MRNDIASYLTFWFLIASVACGLWIMASGFIENLPAITAYVKANPAFSGMLICWAAAGASFMWGISR